jgi:hypothetical protein
MDGLDGGEEEKDQDRDKVQPSAAKTSDSCALTIPGPFSPHLSYHRLLRFSQSALITCSRLFSWPSFHPSSAFYLKIYAERHNLFKSHMCLRIPSKHLIRRRPNRAKPAIMPELSQSETADDAILAQLGKKQVLKRRFAFISLFGFAVCEVYSPILQATRKD